jgi:hypothetical protein
VQTLRAAAGIWIIFCGCLLQAHLAAAEDVDFERHIAGILVRRCAACHAATDPAGGLNLMQRDTATAGGESGLPAIAAGNPAQSNLLLRIGAGEMPPEGKGAPVTAAELAQLENWIKAGAAWPRDRVLSPFEFTTAARAGRDWWSLRRPVRPAIPQVRHADRARTPIDAFVLAALEPRGLELSPEADRGTLIRRASLDLLGLPPSPQEIDAFVADASPDAYERLIDRLLASPRYGERWARHWLDVVRFGESNGYETNTIRANAWPYRDWLIGALNDDIPYRQFVLEQLAGDQVGADAAAGFLVGGAHDIVFSPDVELTRAQRMNDLDDIISTTAAAFLGLTVGCARCHDHKFDPIAQRDYYALQAIFAGVQHGERELRSGDWHGRRQQRADLQKQRGELENQSRNLAARHQPLAQLGGADGPRRPAVSARANIDRFAPTRARFIRFTVLATSQSEPCLDELEVFATDGAAGNLAAATRGAKATASSVYAGGESALHRLPHVNDGRYGNSRSWISAEPGSGWVQIELPESATVECVVWARDREGAFRDRLATRYQIELSEDGAAWRVVANGDDRQTYDPQAEPADAMGPQNLPPAIAEQLDRLRGQIASLDTQIDELAPRQVYAGAFSKPEATHVLYRGEPLQPREQVAPGAIASVAPALQLDVDASDAERRLALARWITSDDNPLSARVMANRIWHYHFGQGLVRTPGDFGFNGGTASHPELLDWLATEFLAQGGRAKALHRAIMLSATYRQASRHIPQAAAQDAGARLLWRYPSRRLEAEPLRDSVLFATGTLDLRMGGPGYDVFEPNTNYVKVYAPKKSFGPAEWRRMVYQTKPRMRQDATFGEFDCPDSSQSMARRNVSTTALQALNLLNGPFMVQQASLFAERIEREAGSMPTDQVRRAFRLALGREPDADESVAASALVEAQGLLVFCRALLNANEFLYLN